MHIVRTGVAAALAMGALATANATDVHGATGLIADLSKRDLVKGSADWKRLTDYLSKSFPDVPPPPDLNSLRRIWSVGPDFMVFSVNREIADGVGDIAIVSWFDRQSKPLSTSSFQLGNMHMDRCILVPLPGTSAAVLEAYLRQGQSGDRVQAIYGLLGHRLVLIRYQRTGGGLLRHSYGFPAPSFSPALPGFTRPAILKALKGSNPVTQLEALTWLSGTHVPAVVLSKIKDAPMVSDIKQYASLIKDKDVLAAASSLKQSKVRWVSQAAAFLDSVNRGQ